VGGIFQKFQKLVDCSGMSECVREGDVVAIKLHMGEYGNARYIRPVYVNYLVEKIKGLGGKPFVTDTTVIYRAPRRNYFEYLEVARRNGFTAETMGCPVVIADGLRDNGMECEVPEPLYLDKVNIARAIFDADVLISVAHVTLHFQFPLAATIKNLGMGCVTKPTKTAMHGAKSDEGANRGIWKATADGAKAVAKKFQGKLICYNFAIDITPSCDCDNRSDLPIVPDLGIYVSMDPIAVDRAVWDSLQKARPYPGSVWDPSEKRDWEGARFLQAMDTGAFWDVMQRSQLGSLNYELIEIVK